MGHAKPQHPLLSLFHLDSVQQLPFPELTRSIYDFYCITLIKNTGVQYRYGQHEYNFNEGTLFFYGAQPGFWDAHE